MLSYILKPFRTVAKLTRPVKSLRRGVTGKAPLVMAQAAGDGSAR